MVKGQQEEETDGVKQCNPRLGLDSHAIALGVTAPARAARKNLFAITDRSVL